MKKSISAIGLTISSLLISTAAYSASELWSLAGFSNPESALYDSARDVIYVSNVCLLYTSPSPRDATLSRMPSSA